MQRSIVSRRQGLLLVAAGLCGCASRPSTTLGPTLWRLDRGASRVYILGFAEARDARWLTPKIESALRESDELWLETPATPGAPELGLTERLGFEEGRTLFEVLGPELSARVVALADELGVAVSTIEPMRPWLAHYVLSSARGAFVVEAGELGPQAALIAQANANAIPIHSEFESFDDLIAFYAAMPDAAQREYIADLLDYIDDEKAGRLGDITGWTRGQTDTRLVERQQTLRPALYKAMHTERNRAWAHRIEGMLDSGRTYFVLVGLNHVLGRDSILNELEAIGLRPRA